MALSVAVALRMGWSADDATCCGLTALLADVGMRLVHDEIRSAARTLDDVETRRMQRHAALSALLALEAADLPETVPPAVYAHHERDDGTGYPLGLRAPVIPDVARVVAVADCFAAATAQRPHRPPHARAGAIREIMAQGSMGMLDRRAVEALVAVCGLHPVGSIVRLSDNTMAQVIGVTPAEPSRPWVTRVGPGGDVQTLDLWQIPSWQISVLDALDMTKAA